MEIKDLRYFVAVYEEKGFSRAARALGTVQSNVSMRIAALESFLGTTLFHRRHRSIAPTAAGETLYRQAKEVLAALELIERMMKGNGNAAASGGRGDRSASASREVHYTP